MNDIIKDKIKLDLPRLYRLIARQVGFMLNGLSGPCFRVKTKNFQYIIYREIGVSEKEWKNFAVQSENQLGAKGKGNTYRVPFTYALAYLYYRAIKANKLKMAETFLLYSLIKYYGSAFDKFLPNGCHDETFRYTIENLVKVHLYHREKTIANALIFLSKHIHKKFSPRIKKTVDWPIELMHDFMHDGRDRVNQSTRTLGNAYYKYREIGKGISINADSSDDDENKNMNQTTTGADRKTAAIDKFIKSMFVYKNYDRGAIQEAKTVSRVKNNLAETIIPVIHNKKSQENIKIILTSFLKEVLDTKSLCGKEFFKLVKGLMMKRNYKDSFVFRNLVIEFSNSLYEEAAMPTKQINHRDKISLDLFIALYITTSFRNLFC